MTDVKQNDPEELSNADIWKQMEEESATDKDVADDSDEEEHAKDFDLNTQGDDGDDEDKAADADDEDSGDDDDHSPAEDAASAKPTYDDLLANNAKLERQYKAERGRAIGQQRAKDRLAVEIEKLQTKIERRAAVSEEDETERRQRLSASVEEYGDVVSPLVEELEDMKSRLDDAVGNDEERLAELISQSEDQNAEELQKLMDEHPDGLAVIDQYREDFIEWIEDQPKQFRDIYASNRESFTDGKGAALLVNRFKLALAEPAGMNVPKSQFLTERRKSQLQGATNTKSTTARAVVGEPDADSDDKSAHWAHFDRMEDRARRRK